MATYDKKNNTWRAEIMLNGKRIRRRGFLTKKSAEMFEVQQRYKAERNLLELPTVEEVLISTLFNSYLSHAAQYKKENSLKRDKICINNWQSFFSRVYIRKTSEIHKNVWRKFVEWRLKSKNPSKRTLNVDLSTIRHIFNWAKKETLVQSNPFADIVLYKQPKPEVPRYLTTIEIEFLENLAEKKNKELWQAIVVLSRTGLRSGELCSLEISDINIPLKKIILRPENTKVSAPRVIPINNKVFEVLQALIESAKQNDRTHLFCTRTGQQQTPGNLNHRFVNLLKEARKQGWSLERVNVHTYRKTYISHLIMQGEDPAKVMEIVGHKEWKTIKRYLALSPSYLDDLKELPY